MGQTRSTWRLISPRPSPVCCEKHRPNWTVLEICVLAKPEPILQEILPWHRGALLLDLLVTWRIANSPKRRFRGIAAITAARRSNDCFTVALRAGPNGSYGPT